MDFQLNKITFSIALAYSALAPQAWAAGSLSTQTYLSYDYSLTGLGISESGNGAVNKSAGYPNQTTPYGVLPSVSVYNNGTDMGVQAVAGGNESGFDIATFTEGPAIPYSDAFASTTFHAIYTNTGTQADSYSFHFNISNGFLQTFPFTNGETAMFEGKVLINDVVAWSSSASLSFDGNFNTTFTSTGTDLNYQQDTNNTFQPLYNFGGYQGVIDLGTINPNESVDVKYILTTSSHTSGFFWYGGAIASVNDPFGVTSGNSQPTIFVSPTIPVPEPDALAMMAVGAGLLASRVRSRKKSS